jgi:hypothetical protein
MSVKDSDVFRNIRHEYRVTRRYVGPVKGIVLDWAGDPKKRGEGGKSEGGGDGAIVRCDV